MNKFSMETKAGTLVEMRGDRLRIEDISGADNESWYVEITRKEAVELAKFLQTLTTDKKFLRDLEIDEAWEPI